MNITPRKINEIRCKISLPVFEAQTSEEQRYVRSINDFYTALADKITAYASESADVIRLYTVDHSTECTGECIKVTVVLSAKKKSDLGFITVRRYMQNTWIGSRLASTSINFCD